MQTIFTKTIEPLTKEQLSSMAFQRHYASALILTQDKKILLQLRTNLGKRFAGCVATFGGAIEAGEQPIQALARELNEELGAQVEVADVISFGAITEAISNYTDVVHAFFWHDSLGTIQGCYEGSPIFFTDPQAVLDHPKSMDYVRWLVNECAKKGLL